MHVDWTVPLGTLGLLVLQFIGCIVAVLRMVAALERAIDNRFADIKLLLNTLTEGDIRELRNRLTKLESGQDEWTRALRQRTHDLADGMQTMVLKIDRLEHHVERVKVTDKP